MFTFEVRVLKVADVTKSHWSNNWIARVLSVVMKWSDLICKMSLITRLYFKSGELTLFHLHAQLYSLIFDNTLKVNNKIVFWLFLVYLILFCSVLSCFEKALSIGTWLPQASSVQIARVFHCAGLNPMLIVRRGHKNTSPLTALKSVPTTLRWSF